MRLRFFPLIVVIALATGACAAASSTPSPESTAAPATEASAAAAASASTAPGEVGSPTPTPTPASDPTTPPAASPAPPATTAAVPAAPTHVSIAYRNGSPGPSGQSVTTTIRWAEADPTGVTIRVYGVTACLPRSNANHTPCLAKGTALPANVRELIASAPASKGKVSWVWPEWGEVGGAVMAHGDTMYESIVIAAYSKAGHSRFVIVATGEQCTDCVY